MARLILFHGKPVTRTTPLPGGKVLLRLQNAVRGERCQRLRVSREEFEREKEVVEYEEGNRPDTRAMVRKPRQ